MTQVNPMAVQAAAAAAAGGRPAASGATGAAAGAAGKAAQDHASLVKAAHAFEAIFTRQLLATMRGAKLSDDDISGSSSVDQFREMADAKMADNLSKQGGLGIANMLIKQLDKST